MKKPLFLLIFSFLFFNSESQHMDEHRQLSNQFILFLDNGQFVDAENMFSTGLQQRMSVETLENSWAGVLQQLGNLHSVEEIEFEDMGETIIARARAIFSSSPVIIQIAFDENKKISGLYFLPMTNEFSYALPPYANPDLYVEEDMFLEVPQGQLPATFTRPVFIDKFPLVIIIHGSGPYDRDGTIGPNKPYRDLAIGLATQGIATFRYDKKTKVYPEYYQEIRSSMTIEEEVLEDAAVAVRYASRIKGVIRRQIYILGHSMGGMLAPRVADENRRVDGIIILGGNARPMEDLIIHQTEYLSSLEQVTENDLEMLSNTRLQANKLKERDFQAVDPTSDYLLNMPAAYWQDLSQYNQLQMATTINVPIMVIHGGRDYQVPREDFDLWQTPLSGKEDAHFAFYPHLNHLFFYGEGMGTPQEYTLPGNVAEEVIKDIARWIKLKE